MTYYSECVIFTYSNAVSFSPFSLLHNLNNYVARVSEINHAAEGIERLDKTRKRKDKISVKSGIK